MQIVGPARTCSFCPRAVFVGTASGNAGRESSGDRKCNRQAVDNELFEGISLVFHAYHFNRTSLNDALMALSIQPKV
jgi:hypothetical protein